MNLKKISRALLIGAAAPLLFAAPSYASGAHSAAALVVMVDHAVVCNGDLCVQQGALSGGAAPVRAWADTTTFTGHFELDSNGCGSPALWKNSPGGTWHAGGQGYTFTVPIDGNCGNNGWGIIAWRHNTNGSYTRLGTVTFFIT